MCDTNPELDNCMLEGRSYNIYIHTCHHQSNSDSGLKSTGIDGIDERTNRLREGAQQKAHSKTPCSDSLKEEEVEEVKKWFHKLDKTGDNVIDIKELDAAMRSLGQKLTEDELRDMINHYDVDGTTKDGDKVLDWEDFCCFAKQYLQQAQPDAEEGNQAPNPKGSINLLKDDQAENAEKSVENSLYRDGWECKRFMYCLKEDGLELIRYDEPKGQSWTIATCQKKCEEYGEGCAMVDIHTWSGNYYHSYNKNQKSCVLYTAANALNWDKRVPEPDTYGCLADKRAMACMHNSMNGKHFHPGTEEGSSMGVPVLI
jgi:hypothetical protein